MVMLHNKLKGNEAYNNMLANVLPLFTPLTPVVGSKRSFFLKVIMLNVKLRMKQRTHCKHIFCPFVHPQPKIGSKGQNIFFSTESHVAYQIKGKKCRTLCKADFMHTPDLGKRSDIEIVQISIF